MTTSFSGHSTKHFGTVGKDKDGNVVTVAGPLTFSSSDDTIVTVTQDGNTVYVNATGIAGNAEVTATDTATGISAVLQVAVEASALTTLSFVEIAITAPTTTDSPAPVTAAIDTTQTI